jgi:hypothetical protein
VYKELCKLTETSNKVPKSEAVYKELHKLTEIIGKFYDASSEFLKLFLQKVLRRLMLTGGVGAPRYQGRVGTTTSPITDSVIYILELKFVF